jgi:hypothetical protein
MTSDMVFTAVKMQLVVFWVVISCSDVVGYQPFGGSCCFHLHSEDRGSITSLHGVTTIGTIDHNGFIWLKIGISGGI